MKKPTTKEFLKLNSTLEDKYGIRLSAVQQVDLILNPEQNSLFSWYHFAGKD